MAINQTQLIDLLAEHRRQGWKGIQTPEWQRKIVLSLVQNQEPRILRRIEPFFGLPADPVILDLGSGIGNFVVACRQNGLRVFGVEPDRIGKGTSVTSLRIASKRLDPSPFAAAVGEQLPFADATFDLVVMDQVIEHVADQRKVLAEAWRVLKPGGAMYVAWPNYLRFYESHYKVWFLPLLPKFLGAFYLRLRRRDPVLLNQITYTTNSRLRKLLTMTGVSRFQDMNEADFVSKFRGQGMISRSPKARFVRRLCAVPVLASWVFLAASFYIRLREGGSEMLAFKEA